MTKSSPNAAVWFEIPVRDLARAKSFYGAVIARPLKDEQMGPNPTAVFAYLAGEGVSGHLYRGEPAKKGTGGTVHLAVDGLEDALARVGPAGGEVVSPIIAIPAGRFAYCLDPDGNSFGLFSA
jgi:hypothetical protein